MTKYDFDFIFAYQESLDSKLITSKHRIIEFLSKKGYKILYIEVPIFFTSWIYLRIKKILRNKNSYSYPKNITCIRPLTFFPTKFIFDNKFFADIETLIVNFYLKVSLKRFFITTKYFQIYIPKSINLLKNNFIKSDLIIYHLVDDFRYLLRAPRVLSFYHELTIEKSNIIFTPSINIAEEISSNKVHILPHGFKRYNFNNQKKLDILSPKNNILYYGQLNKLNYELVNKVISSLRDFNFIFVGNLSKSNINQMENVKFVNFISHKKLMFLLKNCQLLWCPFKKNKLTNFMTPIKFLESLSYGVPVLSTQINFKEETLQELIEFKDKSSEHISFIKNFQQRENNLKKINRIKSVEKRTWDVIIKQYFYTLKIEK